MSKGSGEGKQESQIAREVLSSSQPRSTTPRPVRNLSLMTPKKSAQIGSKRKLQQRTPPSSARLIGASENVFVFSDNNSDSNSNPVFRAPATPKVHGQQRTRKSQRVQKVPTPTKLAGSAFDEIMDL